ncbi:alanine racemase [Rhodobacteraceae bacterium NNCM2]|nr:alanine racemase [Coraliihabitans acroporae]
MLKGHLTIDLGALRSNWKNLDALTAPECETGAVIKANAYGCGIDRVAPALAEAGCRTFFVATPEEGVTLRAAVPGASIRILSGYSAGEEATFRAHDLRPVLNAPEQVAAWMAGPAGPAFLQLDTSMNRLGLEPHELQALGPLPGQITHLMSHLACGDTPDHPQNETQLKTFREMTAGHPQKRSLAATAGVLLGPDYHFDLTRPGIGLFGGLPYEDALKVVSLEVPILQIRDVAVGEPVGYGATWVAERPSRIATAAAGYADGLIRAMGSGPAKGYLNGQPVPFAGRVSMDLITLDVTDAPDAAPGGWIEILGPNQSIDDLAQATGTIGYEILTSLGFRYSRHYS